MDFEFDTGVAVPRFAGCHPYDKIPFQWVMCVQEAPDAALGDAEMFLHLHDTDPRTGFAESLLAALPQSGSIVAHHANAEKEVLKQLGERLGGDIQERLSALSDRLVDTEVIGKAGYYHPEQQGSWSIKKLAPCLVGQGYEDLALQNGMAAVMAWRRAIDPDTRPDERERLRQELSDYCGRDASS